MIDTQYIAGALALLVLAWLALTALTTGRKTKKSDTSYLVKRAIIGIIASLVTRVMLNESGLGTSSVTLWSVSIGAGLAIALVYRG